MFNSNNFDLICGGFISTTHGIKGELLLDSNSSFANQRFRKGKSIFLFEDEDTKNPIELIIENARYHKQKYILKFYNYDSINSVEKFKKKIFYFKKNEVILEKDEYFLIDLIGFKVYDVNDQYIGEVETFIDQKVYYSFVIKLKKLDSNTSSIINIPILKKIIKYVNIEKRVIKIDLRKDFFEWEHKVLQ